mmetsp:Transcript_14536/g.43405  ORF Transcript_14536/g.43405 Transcript_14536/m.43405 type:complete len:429 (-) Transcript_14536:296-1582(-)
MFTPGTSMPREITFVVISTFTLPSRKASMTRSRSFASRPPVRSSTEKFLSVRIFVSDVTSRRVLMKMMAWLAASSSKMSSMMPSLPLGCSAASHHTCAISFTMTAERSVPSSAAAMRILEAGCARNTDASMSRQISAVYVAEKQSTWALSGSARRIVRVSSRCPLASISSASSRTSMEIDCVLSWRPRMSWMTRPGVPTTTCATTGSFAARPLPPPRPRPPLPLPPPSDTAAAMIRPRSSLNTRPMSSMTRLFWFASSREGHTTSACVSGFARLQFCRRPSAKAAVLPLPDLACASTLWRTGACRKPARMSGSAASWILKGFSNLARYTPRSSAGSSCSSSQVRAATSSDVSPDARSTWILPPPAISMVCTVLMADDATAEVRPAISSLTPALPIAGGAGAPGASAGAGASSSSPQPPVLAKSAMCRL